MTHLFKTILRHKKPVNTGLHQFQEYYIGQLEEIGDTGISPHREWIKGYNYEITRPNREKITLSIKSAISKYKTFMEGYDSNPKFYVEGTEESYDSGQSFLTSKRACQLAVNFEVESPQDLENILSTKDLILVSSKVEKRD
jgi:hypothetical protein